MAENTTSTAETTDAGFDPMDGSAPRQAKNFWPSIKRLFSLLAPFKRRLWAVAAMNIVCIFLAVVAPKIMGKTMDVIFAGVISRNLPSDISAEQAIAGLRAQGQDRFADMASAMDFVPGEGIDFNRLGTLIITVIAMYIVSSGFQWWQGAILNKVSMDTVFDLRERVEAKVNALPLNYFDSQQRGDILSRTTNDIDNVQQALQQALSQLFYDALLVIGITIMMFSVSWQLALVALLSLPLTGLVIGVIGSRSQRQFTTQWRSTGQLNGQVEESFSGHDLAIVFGRTEAMTKEFDKRNEELYRSAAKAQFLSGIMMPIMQFLSYLSYVAIAVLGGLRVANGHMTLGAATAFIQYSREFNQPLGQLGGMMQQVQSGVASAERVFELLDAEEQAPDTTDEDLPGRAQGLVEFQGVDFSYAKDKELITGLNLRVEPGQTAAIVGPPVPARPHWLTCSCASMSSMAVRFSLMGTISPACRAIPCVPRWAWCSRTPCSSRAPSWRTSATAAWMRRTKRSSLRQRQPMWTASSTRCPMATTPSSTKTAVLSRSASASSSPSPARSWPSPRCSSSMRPPLRSIPVPRSSSKRR